MVLLCCVTLAQANILQYPGVDHTFAFGTRLPIMIMSTDTATQMPNSISKVVIQLVLAASISAILGLSSMFAYCTANAWITN